VPEPEITAPTDVIVRVGAAGFCRTDIHIWDGQFDEAWKGAGIGLPFVPGHETAGWVHEVGSAVTHIAVGDAVLLHPSFLSSIVGTYNEAVKLVALVARGALKLTKTTFPLEGVNDALHALDEGRMIGRGVLVPNES
jgi:D-arabinose 1-dehydrogenase-like Zn-dependent alcohol dehydrogenase